MIDTVKLGIPLTETQFKRVWNFAFRGNNPQWGILYPETGELLIRRVNGLASTDQESFHREVRWDIPYSFGTDATHLTVELSLPKLYYGHNIHLLYDFTKALELLKAMLEKQFGLKGRLKLIDVYDWKLWRLDCCYAWRTPSEVAARQVIDALCHIHFPRKKPHVYPGESILFAGATYSLKFYRKLPEYKQHDMKAMLKAKASLEWINHCEELATGVVRVEATLRHKYLKRKGITTVNDLLEPTIHYEFDLDTYPEGYDLDSAFMAITSYQMDLVDDADWSYIAYMAEDGQRFDAPEGYELETYSLQAGTIHYRHNGGGFTLRKTDKPTAILQYLLTKFLGQNPGTQHTDEVEAKLNAAFKPNKAAHLMAVWLYVQRFGTQKAKEAFGKNPYYQARKAMKEAGVSLMEPPKNVVRLESRFWDKYRVEVPSDYVTNPVDDFRDGGNVLNLPRVVSD